MGVASRFNREELSRPMEVQRPDSIGTVNLNGQNM
jgi:hypothetical protein